MSKNLKRWLQKLFTVTLLLILTQTSFAAGPRAKDLYFKVGAGVFTPTFDLLDGYRFGIDGPPTGVTNTTLGGETTIFSIVGTSDDLNNRIENKQILSMGGSAGYQINPHIGVELHLNFGFITIALRDTFVDSLFVEGAENAGTSHIPPPALLPIGATITYSPFPSALISPYIGLGGVLALLDNRRAGSPPTDLAILDGGGEFGVLVHGGFHLNITKDWFAFLDVKYGYIDQPNINDRGGQAVPVDFFDFRHFSVGAAKRF
ncbi:MAG: hypothetical protein COB04_03465 [Gammaproteobacteria bacterium]|nr:MAG: hypothetical protein COB04_03465 [Gammaproteobacteria bacterium]